MVSGSGLGEQRSRSKMTVLDYDYLWERDNAVTARYCLTQRDIATLLALLAPYDRATRWASAVINPLDSDQIQAYVHGLELRLMQTCDCPSMECPDMTTNFEVIEVGYIWGTGQLNINTSGVFAEYPAFNTIIRDDTGQVSIASQGILNIPAGNYIYDFTTEFVPSGYTGFLFEAAWREDDANAYYRQPSLWSDTHTITYQGSFETESADELQALINGLGTVCYATTGFTPRMITKLRLLRIVQGEGGGQVIPAFRLQDCELQYSFDDETWLAVDGWFETAGVCFQGPAGQPGQPGEPGDDAEGGTNGNEDIPDVTSYEGDDLCAAATYLADQTIKLVNDVIDDLQNFTAQEAIEGLFGIGGWKSALIVQLVGFLETQELLWPTLQQDLIDERDTLICELYTNGLNKEAAVLWALDFAGWTTAAGQSIAGALEAITDGKWSLWAFVGSNVVTVYNCSGCPENWRATYDFTVQDCDWEAELPGSAIYVAGSGWRAADWEYEGEQQTRLLMTLAITGSVHITAIEVTVSEYTSGGGFYTGEWLEAVLTRYSSPLTTYPTSPVGTKGQNINETYVDNLPNCVDVRCTNRDRYGGSCRVSQVVIEGSGVPPAEIVASATTFEYI